MNRRQGRGGPSGRRNPYNQGQNLSCPYQDPQIYDQNDQGSNQGSNYQNPSPRRRGRREYNNQPTHDTRQEPSRNDIISMLKKIVEKF